MSWTVTELGRNARMLVSEALTTHTGITSAGDDELTDALETDGWTKAFCEFNVYGPAGSSNAITCEYKIKAWSVNEDGVAPTFASADFWYNGQRPSAFEVNGVTKRHSAGLDRTRAGVLIHLPPRVQFSVESIDTSYAQEFPPDAQWSIKITLQK